MYRILFGRCWYQKYCYYNTVSNKCNKFTSDVFLIKRYIKEDCQNTLCSCWFWTFTASMSVNHLSCVLTIIRVPFSLEQDLWASCQLSLVEPWNVQCGTSVFACEFIRKGNLDLVHAIALSCPFWFRSSVGDICQAQSYFTFTRRGHVCSFSVGYIWMWRIKSLCRESNLRWLTLCNILTVNSYLLGLIIKYGSLVPLFKTSSNSCMISYDNGVNKVRSILHIEWIEANTGRKHAEFKISID